MLQKYLNPYYIPAFSAGEPRLTAVSFLTAQSNKSHPRLLHRHEDAFELLFITEGAGSYFIGSAYCPIQAGDLVVCNANVLHDADEERGFAFYALRLSDLSFQDLPKNHLTPEGTSAVFPSGSRAEIFHQLFSLLFSQADPACRQENFCHHLMMAILNLAVHCIYVENMTGLENAADNAFPQRGKDGAEPRGDLLLLYRIKDYIDRNFADDLSLEDLAATFGLTASSLSRSFKKCFSMSPVQYIVRRRIGEAQSLLITTSRSITDIAAEVGFGNSSYFSAQFTRYVGMPPRQFRKSYI